MPIGAFKLNGIAKYLAPAASRTAKTITASGDAKVSTAQSKFGGASAVFDGTADYLTVPTDSDLQFTSSESWTIELWFRPTTVAGADQRHMLATYALSGSFNGWGFKIGQGAGTDGIVYFWDGVSWRAFNTTVAINTWYHAAIVSNAGSCKMYLNGTEQTTTFTATSSINNTTNNLTIGSRVDGSNAWNGYMDEIRISNSARYTSSFTAPTAAFTNDANTVLLIHADGLEGSTTFIDDGGTFSARTAATVSGSRNNATGKFSNAHTSTGGFTLTINQSPTTIGSGQAGTIEFWLYRPSTNGDPTTLGGLASIGGFRVSWYSDGRLYIEGTAYQDYGNNAISTNTWVHVVIQTNGSGTWQTYINGSRKYNSSVSTSFSTATLLPQGSSTKLYRIDEIRISKIARYSGATITVPTTAFTNDIYTLALFHCNSTTETDDNA